MARIVCGNEHSQICGGSSELKFADNILKEIMQCGLVVDDVMRLDVVIAMVSSCWRCAVSNYSGYCVE